LSATVLAGLNYAMLRNDWTMVSQSIWSVTGDKSIDRIRILDAKGIVHASSAPVEVGAEMKRSDPACQPCHASSARPSTQQKVVTSSYGSDTLVNVSLIHNQVACQTCHDSREVVLGLLMVEMPLTELNRQLAADFWLMALTALISFVLLVGMMAPAMRRLILQPIGELTRGIVEIKSGNMDYSVQVASRDELGDLALAFDSMRLQLKSTRGEMERREKESIALYRLMMKVSASLELDRVLQAIAQGARHILEADMGAVALIDDVQHQVVIKALSGARTDFPTDLVLTISEIARGRLPEQPVLLETSSPALAVPEIANLFAKEGLVSALMVPMWRGGRLYGYVGILQRQPRQYTSEDQQLLMRLVLQVSVAIDNAELYRQVRYMATLEERDRLAREFHDTLAQKLGYLNVKASITDKLLSGNEIVQAQASLDELKRIAKEAFTEVREGIFSLRTTSSSTFGLVPALQVYLAKYRDQYGVDTELVVQDGYHARLPAEADIQITRIVQEALMNVRKHTNAGRARIHVLQIDHHVCIRVEDRGPGFDPVQVAGQARPSFGLQIMRERAESIGGDLEIDSGQGRGTCVIVRVPLKTASPPSPLL
jgi:nitrate/nitrite-specific signal transduction histidine kinase